MIKAYLARERERKRGGKKERERERCLVLAYLLDHQKQTIHVVMNKFQVH